MQAAPKTLHQPGNVISALAIRKHVNVTLSSLCSFLSNFEKTRFPLL